MPEISVLHSTILLAGACMTACHVCIMVLEYSVNFVSTVVLSHDQWKIATFLATSMMELNNQ